jgi:mannosyl-3-phosphoglycerate phosphatase
LKAESKTVIFTDIDGTILSEENSWQETKPMIENILSRGAALVFCSSKTKTEIESFRRQLNVTDPFISENGGAIFIPKGYFPFAIPRSKQTKKYDVIELGSPYPEVRAKLARISSAIGVEIVGFGDMTASDIAKETGLPLAVAVSAKNREYDEPFRIVCGKETAIAKAFEAEGLTLAVGSKFLHALANTDKGKAVTVLKSLFARGFGEIITYGAGDGGNDLPMLAVVDVPQLVRRKMGGNNANLVAWRNLMNMI